MFFLCSPKKKDINHRENTNKSASVVVKALFLEHHYHISLIFHIYYIHHVQPFHYTIYAIGPVSHEMHLRVELFLVLEFHVAVELLGNVEQGVFQCHVVEINVSVAPRCEWCHVNLPHCQLSLG